MLGPPVASAAARQPRRRPRHLTASTPGRPRHLTASTPGLQTTLCHRPRPRTRHLPKTRRVDPSSVASSFQARAQRIVLSDAAAEDPTRLCAALRIGCLQLLPAAVICVFRRSSLPYAKYLAAPAGKKDKTKDKEAAEDKAARERADAASAAAASQAAAERAATAHVASATAQSDKASAAAAIDMATVAAARCAPPHAEQPAGLCPSVHVPLQRTCRASAHACAHIP